jgi:hypothetical protein
MKFSLFVFVLLVGVSAARGQANAIDTYFQGYVEDERFSVVYISPRLFQLFDQIGSEQLELTEKETSAFKDMASDLRGLRILTTDIQPAKFYQEAIQKIDAKLYEPLITIRERNGGKTAFMIRETKDGILEELLFLSFSDTSFTLMSFVGRLNLDKILRVANEMEKGN